jgi:hypothetical protein
LKKEFDIDINFKKISKNLKILKQEDLF